MLPQAKEASQTSVCSKLSEILLLTLPVPVEIDTQLKKKRILIREYIMPGGISCSRN